MKIIDIETKNKLIFYFKYKEKPHNMVVDILAKTSKFLIIPAILDKNQMVDTANITEARLVYTVKDGVFQFTDIKITSAIIMDMRVFMVSSFEDVSRLNRREAYRVFIGEILKVTAVSKGGRKRVLEGILKDVSVLGMGVILKSELEMGSTLSIIYNYEGLVVPLSGEVIRKEKIGRYRAFTYGCKFTEPNNNINRIVLLKQLKNKNENMD